MREANAALKWQEVHSKELENVKEALKLVSQHPEHQETVLAVLMAKIDENRAKIDDSGMRFTKVDYR
ncbi:MAG: hypothetical protein GEU82_09455 [Luteitalea sp.]|nr:hypothetical protein [Luteitalea sp.]